MTEQTSPRIFEIALDGINKKLKINPKNPRYLRKRVDLEKRLKKIYIDVNNANKGTLTISSKMNTSEYINYDFDFKIPGSEEMKLFRHITSMKLLDIEQKSGVPYESIRRIENGKQAPHKHWVKLCKYYSSVSQK